jgi:hypothetical protein
MMALTRYLTGYLSKGLTNTHHKNIEMSTPCPYLGKKFKHSPLGSSLIVRKNKNPNPCGYLVFYFPELGPNIMTHFLPREVLGSNCENHPTLVKQYTQLTIYPSFILAILAYYA